MAMFRRKRRVPCKLNNVTKRKHQRNASETVRTKVVGEYGVVNSSESSNYKTEEAMTNSSIKDLGSESCLDTIY